MTGLHSMVRFSLQIGDCLKTEKTLIFTAADRGECVYVDIDNFDRSRFPISPVPVGSVEFVRRYAKIYGIALPDFPTYPESIQAYLNRKIWIDQFCSVADDVFVKPVATKIFTGAIKSSITEYVPSDTQVWVSPAIQFDQEWRFYILEGNVVGYARYDDLESDDLEPPCVLVAKIASEFRDAPVGYSLDMGHSFGHWSLIEANDGWSLGYYRVGTMTTRGYMRLITARWNQISGAASAALSSAHT